MSVALVHVLKLLPNLGDPADDTFDGRSLAPSALFCGSRVIWRGEHRPIGCHPWSFADRIHIRVFAGFLSVLPHLRCRFDPVCRV